MGREKIPIFSVFSTRVMDTWRFERGGVRPTPSRTEKTVSYWSTVVVFMSVSLMCFLVPRVKFETRRVRGGLVNVSSMMENPKYSLREISILSRTFLVSTAPAEFVTERNELPW